MADTYTSNLNLTQPEVGASQNSWGSKLNGDMALIDAVFAAGGTGTSVGLNVGNTKTIKVSGTLTITGVATAVTQAVGDDSTNVATTEYVVAQIANDAPTKSGLGATGSWAISITGNAATATTATNALNATTQLVSDDSTKIATTAFVADKVADYAPTKTGSGASGTWGISISGTAATATNALNATTQSVSDDSTKIATTAFVADKVANYAPSKSGSGATGTWAIGISGNAATATNATNATTASIATTVIDNSITTAKISNLAVTMAKIGATGTPSSSNYLRGDGTWAAAPTLSAVTSITAGAGLSGGTITSTGTIAVDVYTGSTSNNTSYAVGHTLWCETTSEVTLNSTVVPKVSSGDTHPSTTGTSTISGTWKARGSSKVVTNVYDDFGALVVEYIYMTLIQRVS